MFSPVLLNFSSLKKKTAPAATSHVKKPLRNGINLMGFLLSWQAAFFYLTLVQ
jgi:hypothetical protein